MSQNQSSLAYDIYKEAVERQEQSYAPQLSLVVDKQNLMTIKAAAVERISISGTLTISF